MKKYIPNLLTSANLFCGCLGVIQVFQGEIINAVYLIFLAALFDFLDGFVARMLKVSSPIGKDLDSLADMVTFGFLPGMIVYYYFNQISEIENLKYLALIIPIFSALRLAKFNNDPRQSDIFIGIATPTNAFLVASLPLIEYFSEFQFLNDFFLSIPFLVFLSIGMSLMLVSEIPFLALKFKHFKFKGNESRFILLFLAIVLLIFLKFVALPFIVLIYMVLSLANYKKLKNEIQSRN